jgi:hypothetical protein
LSLKTVLDKALLGVEAPPEKKAETSTDILKQKPPSLLEIIEESQDIQKERRGFLRPSAILGCDRQNVFRLLRAPKSPERIDNRIQRILDNGTAVHSVVQGYLARHHDWWFAPEAKVLQEVDGTLIKGSCDGILIRRSDGYRFGIEVKTINHESWLKLTRPDPKHVFQASIYAVMNKVWWITIYYWDKDKQNHKEYPVSYDSSRWQEIKDRVKYLRGLADASVGNKPLHWPNATSASLPVFDKKQCDPNWCDYSEFCRHMGAPVT